MNDYAKKYGCVFSGYAHSVNRPLEQAGWERVEIEVSARSSQTRTKRTECLCIQPLPASKLVIRIKSDENLTKRQAAAYRVHELRT